MKISLIVILLLLNVGIVVAQSVEATKPQVQSIQPKAVQKEISSVESYIIQFNYIFKNATQKRSTKEIDPEQLNRLQSLAKQIRESEPSSFEAFYYTYLSQGMDLDYFYLLQNAYSIQPQNNEVKKQLFLAYEAMGKKDSAQFILNDLYQSLNSSFEQIYLTDVIKSVPPGGILLTHGVEDYIKVKKIQTLNKKLQEVPVISFELMRHNAYGDILRKRGYKVPEKTELNNGYLFQFLHANDERLIVLSSTFPSDYFVTSGSGFLTIGLSFDLSEVPKDYAKLNVQFFEQGIKKNIQTELKKESPNKYLKNYIPLLVSLHAYYTEKKQVEKVKEVEQIAKTMVQKLMPELDYKQLFKP